MSMTASLQISSLGAQGHGIAMLDDEQIFVPGALPGEHVRATVEDGRARIVEITEPSAERAEPPCPHFGTCGGCAVQHMASDLYASWKRGLVTAAFERHGIRAEVGPLVPCQPHTRRRALFTARNLGHGDVPLGFLKPGTHEVVDLDICHVITPGLDRLRPTLKALAQTCILPGRKGTLTVLDSNGNFDVAIKLSAAIDDDTRRGLVKGLAGTPIGRLTVNGETLFAARPPVVEFGTVTVTPPPGGFLQTVAEAEIAMAHLVTGHLAKSKTVLDLFAGSGTFSLRLAAKNAVHAVEGEAAALDAMQRAWRDQAGDKGLRKLTTEKRDLFMSPIPARDLDDYRGIVLDPPRPGAEAQVKQIAKSSVPKIAAVSCNPVTLARDLSILLEAGYRLDSVVAIDQFLWSTHVEVVALLSKPSVKKRRGLA